MRITLFILLCFMTSSMVQAQNHLLGVTCGINNSYVTDKNTFKDKIGKNGLAAGITYQYNFKKKFAVGVDVLFSQKGFGNYYVLGDGLDPITGGNGMAESNLIYFQYDYITIPISFSYTIGSKVFMFTAIALAPSYLVNAKMYADNEADKPSYNNNANKFELSGQVELGAGYRFRKKIDLYVSLARFQSFNGVSSSNYYPFSETTNYGYNASIGIRRVF